MAQINKHLLTLKSNYLFAEIENRVQNLLIGSTDISLINLGIGDITIPLSDYITDAICQATQELSSSATLKGYGPAQGYLFLREAIINNDYKNLNITPAEIFISNGTKCDSSNIQDLFSDSNIVAITDPAYPVYVDISKMTGKKIVYIPCFKENDFQPLPPKEHVDLIYLCSPNNPTGTVLTKETLLQWVDYAKKEKALIFFDGAYEAFITSENIPRSIYEIEGAKDVAIEFRSFSKKAGFTGLRCSYLVIPKSIYVDEASIHALWSRRINSKFGGIAYPIQKGAEAIYSEKGQKEINKIISTYQSNTQLLLNGLKELNFEVFGGVDAPYVWCKTPNNLSSWEFFDLLLNKYHLVCVPGEGFGNSGKGFVRFSGFAKKENIMKALNNLKNL